MGKNLAESPLFIVSMWRSGSSLLYALLNQHPQVSLMYEADLMLLRPVFWKPKAVRDWPQRWEFWNAALSRHQIPVSEAVSGQSFRDAFREIHGRYASVRGANIWGDKSPNYYDRMFWLAKRFPGARFLVVWRNPEDTARSIIRAAESGNSYFQKRGMLARALIGYRVFRKQYESLRRLGVAVHALHYEDLTRNPRDTMQGVCDFLDIPLDPAVLTLENADRSSIYEGEHHTFVKGDEIVLDRDRPEVLDSEWKAKIERYVRYWQGEEGDWPAYPKFEMETGRVPSLYERLRDRVEYAFWRFFDLLTAVVFSFAPMRILDRHRRREYQELPGV